MNERIKQKWIKRLRSDKYEQGEGKLKSNDKYCCLGVLCEIAVEEGIAEWREYNNKNYIISSIDTNISDTSLTRQLRGWAGIEVDDGLMLIAHNDKTFDLEPGFSFNEIAQLIEDYL